MIKTIKEEGYRWIKPTLDKGVLIIDLVRK